jgi:hypothetical protein
MVVRVIFFYLRLDNNNNLAQLMLIYWHLVNAVNWYGTVCYLIGDWRRTIEVPSKSKYGTMTDVAPYWILDLESRGSWRPACGMRKARAGRHEESGGRCHGV